MDYKELYLKYKKKYLRAKNNIEYKKSNKNILSGGSQIDSTLDSILKTNKLSNDIFKDCLNSHLDSKSHTYNSITTKPDKNLLVIVYAHWCIHCTNLIKEEGNSLVSSDDSSNIKFIDGTQLDNELNSLLEVRGYPTILKIDKSSTKDKIIKNEFMGNRTTNDLLNFLNN